MSSKVASAMAAEASSPSEHMTWSTDEDDDKEEEQQEDEEEQEEEFEAAEGHDDDDLGPPPDEDDDDVEEDKEVHEEKIAHTNSAVPDELQNKEENEGDIMKARKLSFVSTDLSSLPSVIFQGMIMKKADDSKIRFINPWKKRFLVLTSDFLSYSASEQASNNLNELKAIILLKSSFTCDRSVTGCELTIFDNLLTERKKVKVLHLKAFDSTAAQAWYDHITKAILKKTEISSNLASRSSMKFKGSDIKSVLESLSKEIIVQSTEDGSSLEKEQEKAMAKQINRNPDEEKIACIVSRTKFFMKLKDLDDTRKYRILIDKSASMMIGKNSWKEAQESVHILINHIANWELEGADLYFFSSGSKYESKQDTSFNKYTNVAAPDEVMRLFTLKENQPRGSTDLTAVLSDALIPADKPLSLLLITDGVPDDPASVENLLISAINQMPHHDSILITILQVGDDQRADLYLHEFDNDLVKMGAIYDVVDVISHKSLKSLDFVNVVTMALNMTFCNIAPISDAESEVTIENLDSMLSLDDTFDFNTESQLTSPDTIALQEYSKKKEQLEALLFETEQLGDYKKAAELHLEITQLVAVEEEWKISTAKTRFMDEQQVFQAAHQKLIDDFITAWDVCIETYDNMAATFFEEEKKRRLQLVEKFKNEVLSIAEPYQLSTSLSDRRRHELHLVKHKQYEKARELKLKSDQIEAKDRASFMKRVEESAKKKIWRQKKICAADILAVKNLMEIRRREHIRQRNFDMKRLKKLKPMKYILSNRKGLLEGPEQFFPIITFSTLDSRLPSHLLQPWDAKLVRPHLKMFEKPEPLDRLDRVVFDQRPSTSLYLSGDIDCRYNNRYYC